MCKAIASALGIWGGGGLPIFAKSRVSTPKCTSDSCNSTCPSCELLQDPGPAPPALAAQGCVHGLALYVCRPCIWTGPASVHTGLTHVPPAHRDEADPVIPHVLRAHPSCFKTQGPMVLKTPGCSREPTRTLTHPTAPWPTPLPTMALALPVSARHYPNQASNAQRPAGRHHCLQWHWHRQTWNHCPPPRHTHAHTKYTITAPHTPYTAASTDATSPPGDTTHAHTHTHTHAHHRHARHSGVRIVGGADWCSLWEPLSVSPAHTVSPVGRWTPDWDNVGHLLVVPVPL